MMSVYQKMEIQLRRNLEALSVEIKKDPSADQRVWSEHVEILRGLIEDSRRECHETNVRT
jgi:hypothetical protein